MIADFLRLLTKNRDSLPGFVAGITDFPMSQTLRRLYTVKNPSGLHMRPLQAFVEQASRFKCDVQVGKNGGEMVNGKSMIHLLTLGADQGTEIAIVASGPDAEAALTALLDVLDRIYDDP